MDDDIDIYEDLPSFEAKCSESLVANNDSDKIVVENSELKKEIATLRTKLEDFGKVNKTLEVNLFSLLKTAKAEIARKDKMIDDLRKKLDDMTFRRGTYRNKNNEYTTRRSSIHKMVVNKSYYDLADNRYTPSSEDDSKVFEATCSPTIDHCRLREPENKSSTLAPITVFGERLRKRIADEQTSEKKDKWSRKVSGSGSGGGNYTEGHMIESDKENGSLCDRNFYKGTEILSNGETLKIPSADNRLSKRIEESTAKSTNKRVHEDSNRVVSAKRLKTENGESLFDSTDTKEKKENASVETNAQYHLSKRTDRVESVSNESSEKQHTAAKSTNVGRACESSVELNKHSSVVSEVDGGKRKEGKGYVKPERNSVLAFNETRQRTARTHHDAEPLKRDDHRADNAKHHWSRHAEREDRSSVEYRTRGKFSSYTTRQRKEVHEKNFAQEKRRYDFRATEEKKSTVASKVEEKHDSRSTMRRRATVDREYDTRKTTDSRGRKCIPVREKSVSKTTIDREKKQVENEEHSREKSNACGKLDERSKCSKAKPKRNEKEVEKPVGEVIDRKENKDIVAVSQEEKSEILADIVKNDSSKDLEDGEIASSPNTSPEKRLHMQKVDLPSVVEATKEIVQTLQTETTASPLKLTPKSELLHCVPSTITTVEHPSDAASSTNLLNLDTSENNVENLENIEKFIRDYASNDNIAPALSTVDSSKTDDSSKNNAQFVGSPGTDKHESTSVAENLQDSGKLLANVVASSNQLVVDDLLDDERRETNETVERTCSEEVGKEETRVRVLENINDESTPAEDSLRVTTDLESGKKEEVVAAQATDSSKQIKDDPVSAAAADVLASELLETRTSNEPTDTVPLEINGCVESQTPNEGKDSPQSDHGDNEKATRKDRESKKREDVREKERNGKRAGQEKDGGGAKRGETDGNSRGSGGNRSARDASMSIHGKIVVFVRRKRPVCLEDNNANMTVIVNSSNDRCETTRNSSGPVEEKKR